MTTSATIKHHLEAARHAEHKARAELERRQARVEQLEYQLHEAEVMEAADARRRELMRAVVARMRSGQWVAGVSHRLWWNSDKQALIEPVTADEMEAIHALKDQGIVEGGTNQRVAA